MLKRLMSFLGFSGVATMIWGVVLCLPFETFDATPTYSAMANFFEQLGATTQTSEVIWGVSLLGLGIYRVASMLSNKHIHILTSSYIGCAAWIFVAVQLLLVTPQTIGGYIYMLFALYDISHITRKTQGE